MTSSSIVSATRYSILLCVAFLIAACSSGTSMNNMMNSAGTTTGDVQRFGADSIRSWVTTDNNGNPTSIGVTFSEKAFTTLGNTDTTYMLMFPSTGGMMSMMAQPFDHCEVDWVPGGDPEPPYDSAHLDCHFVMNSMANMMGIGAGRDSMGMNPNYMPGGYMCDSMSEAMMGVHWMDTTAAEFHGGKFLHTLMFGSYHGTMEFIEPMCAASFLRTKTNYTGQVRQPQQYQRSGYFPTTYSVTYDATAKTYTISLDGLSKH